MSNRIFTDEEARRMYEDYKKLKSLEKTGEKWYCHAKTVGNYIRRLGEKTIPKSRSRYPISQIMNDWNSGIPTSRILWIYRFPNKEILTQRMCYWRKRGYDFIRYRERYMTVGESTMASSIRQTRGSE